MALHPHHLHAHPRGPPHYPPVVTSPVEVVMVALLPQLLSPSSGPFNSRRHSSGSSESSDNFFTTTTTSATTTSTTTTSFALAVQGLLTLGQTVLEIAGSAGGGGLGGGGGGREGAEPGLWNSGRRWESEHHYQVDPVYHVDLTPSPVTSTVLSQAAAGIIYPEEGAAAAAAGGEGRTGSAWGPGLGDAVAGSGGAGLGVLAAGLDEHASMVSVSYIALFSTLFCIVGMAGMAGNVLVVYIVLTDKKMRKSVTNLLILNLAVADSLLMVFGVPEIVQFMLDRGWLLGVAACKVNRSVLVAALYASVLTLVAVCIERYIAIVFPIKAHIVCTRRRVIFVIICVWFMAISCCLPTALFNDVITPSETLPHTMCITKFSEDRETHTKYHNVFKYTEFALFYFGPLVLQLVCYVIIGRRLFVGVEKLHRNYNIRSTPDKRQRAHEAIRARKGVVKMLIASVIIYFLSYSPHQVLLFFNTFSSMSFGDSWMFLVLTTTLAYINSAANPLLYCVFSENFRSKFKHILQCCACTCASAAGGSAAAAGEEGEGEGGSGGAGRCWRCRKPYERQRSISLTSLTEYTTLFNKVQLKHACNNSGGPGNPQPTSL